MVVLINPYTGKPVDAAEGSVERLIGAGFRRPVEDAPAPQSPRKRGRPKKSDS